MKYKTNAGPSFAKATEGRPGLIVALGAPADDAGKMGMGTPGEGTGPTGNPNALSRAANTDTVPLSMLSMPDDQEQMQPPEVGDLVSYQVTGKVVAIEGAYAQVQRQSINGQDLPSEEEDPSSQSSDAASEDQDDASSLRSDAAGIGMLS